MKPNFKNIDIGSTPDYNNDVEQWEKDHHIEKNWLTPEKISVKPVYSAHDLKGMEHLNYAAGLPPF